MVVEDEVIVGKDIQTSLRMLNYEVPHLVTSGETAVAMAEKEDPDLVLMDIVLRGQMDGIEAARQIRNRYDIPVIYLTAYSDEKTLHRAKETEPHGYLLKPVNHRELRSTIEMALHKIETEKKLRWSEGRHRAHVESSPDIIYTCKPGDRLIMSVNPAFENVTGWSHAELIGKTFATLVHPDDLSLLVKMNQLLEKRKKTIPYEVRILSKSGNYLEAEFIEVPQRTNGKLVGIMGYGRDITYRKQKEKELLQRSKLESLGSLAGGIAHDFNNLLTVIMGNISLAKIFLKPSDKAGSFLDNIDKASQRARHLISQLVAFSRSDHSIRRAVNLVTLLKDTATLTLNGSSLRAEFFVSQTLWPIHAGETQLTQVITALITNAVETSPKEGVIRVRAENVVMEPNQVDSLQEGNYVMFSIEDQGQGIPEQHLERIFDPYFTTKTMGVQKGMGLSLAIAYAIIMDHDGHITVTSKVGAGTTVTVYLPAAAEGLSPTSHPPS